jgi:tetratricopeptide (TPR) repeat protein
MEMEKGGQIPENGNIKEFFLSKRAEKSREQSTDAQLNWTKEFFKSDFFHSPEDTPFVEAALSRLFDAKLFSVLLVRMDTLDESKHSQENRKALVLCIARMLEEICAVNIAGWGFIEPDIFGCYIKDRTDKETLEIGASLQEQLSACCKETVSIGAAQFPALNFSRGQVFENARKALHHAAFFGPNSKVLFDAVSLNISGDMLYQEGDISGAIREFQTALKIDPSNVNIHNSLGVCYARLGKHEEAREFFSTAKWISPDEVMPVYNLGLVCLITGNRKEALDLFLEAQFIENGIYEVVYQIGKIYLEESDPIRAKPYFEEAVKIRPASGTGYRYLGDCCLAMNQQNEAVVAYKKAVKLNPNDASSLSSLGYLFHTMGENAEIAITFCRQSVQLSPDQGLFRYRLGEIYFRQQKWKEAKEELAAAVRLGHDGEKLLKEIEVKCESSSIC